HDPPSHGRDRRHGSQRWRAHVRTLDGGSRTVSEAGIDVTIDAVLAARVQPFGPKGVPSGIAKMPVQGPLRVTTVGLAIDEQGDPKHHGGPEKALHHYPRDHYARWQDELAEAGGDTSLLCHAGAFGENLTSTGLTEADVCVGDRFRLGT